MFRRSANEAKEPTPRLISGTITLFRRLEASYTPPLIWKDRAIDNELVELFTIAKNHLTGFFKIAIRFAFNELFYWSHY